VWITRILNSFLARLRQRVVFAVIDFDGAVAVEFGPAPALRRVLQGEAEFVVEVVPGFVAFVVTDERRAEQVEVADGIKQFVAYKFVVKGQPLFV